MKYDVAATASRQREGFPGKGSLELKLSRQWSRKGFPGGRNSICRGVDEAWSTQVLGAVWCGQSLGQKASDERL